MTTPSAPASTANVPAAATETERPRSRETFYTYTDVFTDLRCAVDDAFYRHRGARKYDILAGLLRIGLAHQDELPAYLTGNATSEEGS